MKDSLIQDLTTDHGDFLRDESRRVGEAKSISFPQSAEDIQAVLRSLAESKTPCTVQGARTGITAGAVPAGGHILNLSRYKGFTSIRFDGTRVFLGVRSGTLLSEIRSACDRFDDDLLCLPEPYSAVLQGIRDAGSWFLPPDPTEPSASIGGMVACNASGARSFLYGAIRRYVSSLRIVLADGEVLSLQRGTQKAQGRDVRVTSEAGVLFEGRIPTYQMPAVKNAAGFFAENDMDVVDLFIGSEGTLGVVSEVELELIPAPRCVWGLMAFFESESRAVGFVRSVREKIFRKAEDRTGAKVVAMEFFSGGALGLLRSAISSNPAFGAIPSPPASHETAIYVEIHGDDEDAVGEMMMTASDLMVECGGREEDTWMASEPHELQRLKDFRHAVPEAVNLVIDERRKTEPALVKLGTDMSVPDEHLEGVLELYNTQLRKAGLEYVIFGHIGNNHLHVNILPRTLEEYEEGRELYLSWASEVVRLGGSISAEHGVGKLKTKLLQTMYGEKGIAEMKALKKSFDPRGCLNPGNLFEAV